MTDCTQLRLERSDKSSDDAAHHDGDHKDFYRTKQDPSLHDQDSLRASQMCESTATILNEKPRAKYVIMETEDFNTFLFTPSTNQKSNATERGPAVGPVPACRPLVYAEQPSSRPQHDHEVLQSHIDSERYARHAKILDSANSRQQLVTRLRENSNC